MIRGGAQRFAVAALVVLVTWLPGTTPHGLSFWYGRCRLSRPQVTADIRLSGVIAWAAHLAVHPTA
jgi:hypothetical protein